DRDRYATPEVRSRREPIPAVDVDPDEDRLEEEREALEREAESEHVPEARDEVRPEQAELEAQDRAGDDADGEQRQHHVRPAPRHRAVELTARTQVARLGEEHQRRKRDPEADEWDVHRQREGLQLTRLVEVLLCGHPPVSIAAPGGIR